MNVIADWLDVTFSPDESLTWLDEFFKSIGGVPNYRGDNVTYSTVKGGSVHVTTTNRWQRLSLSGRALELLRNLNAHDELLKNISSQPHRITRLDAAYDERVDAAPVVQSLIKQYHNKKVYLSHKPVKSFQWTECRDDGELTGTFYAGHRKRTNITARVYDKEFEMLQNQGLLTGPWLRYEVTVKTGAPSLRDVHSPDLMFWHYASPALLPSPSNVQPWQPENGFNWVPPESLPVDYKMRLSDSVRFSEDIARWKEYCRHIPGGKEYLLKLIETVINQGGNDAPH